MSLLDELLKRIEQRTKEPILPILKPKEKPLVVKEKPPEVPPEYWVQYAPPRRRSQP